MAPLDDVKPPCQIPFFRPSLTEAEIAEVVACLRSGWLTTGPRTRQFEAAFAELAAVFYSQRKIFTESAVNKKKNAISAATSPR